MALQYSVALRNAQLDQIETVVSTSPKLRLYSGAPPATCADAATGTMVLEISLPSDWMDAAAAGSKAKAGTWAGLGDAGAGAGTVAGYFRVWDSGATTCHAQGTVTITGGGGDMTLDNTNISSGQAVTVSTFTVSAGNA